MPLFEKKKTKIGIGIEIDDQSIRIAKISDKKGQLQVDSLSEIQLMENTNSSELKRFFKKNKINKNKVATNINHKNLVTRRMELPPMPQNDLITAIRFNLRDQVEGNIDDYEIRYNELKKGDDPTTKREYMTFSIPNTVIKEKIEKFRKLGLRLEVLEPTAVSLASWFDQIFHNLPGNHILVYGNANIDLFVVVSDGKFIYAKSLLEFDEDDPLDSQIDNQSDDTYLKASLAIQKSIDSFCLINKTEQIDQIITSGTKYESEKFIQYLNTNLGLKAHSMSELFSEKIINNSAENIGPYSVALSLATAPI